MTESAPAPATTRRPPFDPELVPMLDTLATLLPPLSVENLPTRRQTMGEGMPGVPRIDLTAGGAVRVDERQVPGPQGEPLSLIHI